MQGFSKYIKQNILQSYQEDCTCTMYNYYKSAKSRSDDTKCVTLSKKLMS